MNQVLRLKVAKEYLVLLGKLGEPKKALLEIKQRYGGKHGPDRSTIYRYVAEYRKKK